MESTLTSIRDAFSAAWLKHPVLCIIALGPLLGLAMRLDRPSRGTYALRFSLLTLLATAVLTAAAGYGIYRLGRYVVARIRKEI